MKLNPIETLQRDVLAALPGTSARLDAPRDPSAGWFLDLVADAHRVSVEWRARTGFGVSAGAEPGFGEGPEEVYRGVPAATGRVLELLRNRSNTTPPREVRLRELREQVARLTQEELAAHLGIQQAAVSKLENRSDTTVSTLRSAIEAMGGKLEITARFPGETVVRITQFG
jgi:DNA-binding XRE family transcriptional regulator